MQLTFEVVDPITHQKLTFGSYGGLKLERKSVQELRRSISEERDPVQKALGRMELRQPSIGRDERVEEVTDIAALVLGEKVCSVSALVVHHRVGTDFMTNRPKYHEIIIPKVGYESLAPPAHFILS